MSFVPQFTLWDSTGENKLFTFPACQDTNLPQEPTENIVITNLRSSGGIVIGGGKKPFEAFISFWIFGESYEDIIDTIDDLYTTIPMNIPLLLRYDKTSSTYYEYAVKRIMDFEWQGIARDLPLTRQEVTLRLLANAW
jgi:hypothetical protein